jgi:hypothetical protein
MIAAAASAHGATGGAAKHLTHPDAAHAAPLKK